MKLSHVLWNVAGLSLPLVAAVASIPTLLSNIGAERFGFLSLAWALIGYAGVLDFGVGRALTKTISTMLGSGREAEVPSALYTAIRITSVIAVLGSIVLGLMIGLGILDRIKIEVVSFGEFALSALLFAVALPLQALSMTYKGVNEAYLNFKAISLIRIFLGVSTFIFPLALSFNFDDLSVLIASLVLSRLLAVVLYRQYALNCIAHVEGVACFSSEIKSEMLSFGGWFSVSSIINPIIGSLDKLLLSGMVSVAAVSVYSIPYDMVVQSLVIVGALTTVAFPYLTSRLERDKNLACAFFVRLLLASVGGMFFVSLGIYFLGGIALKWWLHTGYVSESSLVSKILVFGLIPYTVGTISVSFLHACGRADLTGKIHLIEFVPFCILVYLSIKWFGVAGAALAWVIRVCVDALIVFLFSRKLMNNFARL